MSAMQRRMLQPWWLIVLLASFFAKLVASNARVAWDVVTPRLHLRPAVLRVPANSRLGDGGLVLFANLISVTPGTLTLEIDRHRRVLYVHAMYPETSGDHVLDGLEQLQRQLIAALYADVPAARSDAEARQ